MTVKKHEENNSQYFAKFFDNLKALGFSKDDIQKYGNTFYEVYFKKLSEEYDANICFDLDETLSKANVYWNLKLGLKNHGYIKYALKFGRKFAKLH